MQPNTTSRRLIFALLALVAVMGIGRLAKAADMERVSGKWHLVLDTEGGPREVDLVLDVKGDKVTGKWNDKDDIQGTATDDKIELNAQLSETEVGPGQMKMVGKLDGDALKGTWQFQTYNGEFKATRSK